MKKNHSPTPGGGQYVTIKSNMGITSVYLPTSAMQLSQWDIFMVNTVNSPELIEPTTSLLDN